MNVFFKLSAAHWVSEVGSQKEAGTDTYQNFFPSCLDLLYMSFINPK